MLHTQSHPIVQPPAQPFTEYFGFREALDRNNAIEEGLLVDVTELARPVFNVPVAMTRSVYELVESINYRDEFAKQWRIRSILVQARIAAKNSDPGMKSAAFSIKAFPGRQASSRIRLWIQIEKDKNRPVLTIMTDYEQHLLEVLS